MNDPKNSAAVRCFAIIAMTAAVIAVIDVIARAFFYEPAQRFAPYPPLLIGSIALCVMGVAQRNRKEADLPPSPTNTPGVRRARVTGPIK